TKGMSELVSGHDNTTVVFFPVDALLEHSQAGGAIALRLIRLFAMEAVQAWEKRLLARTFSDKMQDLSPYICTKDKLYASVLEAQSHGTGMKQGLGNLEAHDVVQLAEYMYLTSCSKGDVIFRKGQQGTSVVFLIHGAVEVTNENGFVIGHRQKGQLIGESAFVDGLTASQPRNATVTAASDIIAGIITKSEFQSMCTEQPELAFMFICEIGVQVMWQHMVDLEEICKRMSSGLETTKKILMVPRHDEEYDIQYLPPDETLIMELAAPLTLSPRGEQKFEGEPSTESRCPSAAAASSEAELQGNARGQEESSEGCQRAAKSGREIPLASEQSAAVEMRNARIRLSRDAMTSKAPPRVSRETAGRAGKRDSKLSRAALTAVSAVTAAVGGPKKQAGRGSRLSRRVSRQEGTAKGSPGGSIAVVAEEVTEDAEQQQAAAAGAEELAPGAQDATANASRQPEDLPGETADEPGEAANNALGLGPLEVPEAVHTPAPGPGSAMTPHSQRRRLASNDSHQRRHSLSALVGRLPSLAKVGKRSSLGALSADAARSLAPALLEARAEEQGSGQDQGQEVPEEDAEPHPRDLEKQDAGTAAKNEDGGGEVADASGEGFIFDFNKIRHKAALEESSSDEDHPDGASTPRGGRNLLLSMKAHIKSAVQKGAIDRFKSKPLPTPRMKELPTPRSQRKETKEKLGAPSAAGGGRRSQGPGCPEPPHAGQGPKGDDPKFQFESPGAAAMQDMKMKRLLADAYVQAQLEIVEGQSEQEDKEAEPSFEHVMAVLDFILELELPPEEDKAHLRSTAEAILYPLLPKEEPLPVPDESSAKAAGPRIRKPAKPVGTHRLSSNVKMRRRRGMLLPTSRSPRSAHDGSTSSGVSAGWNVSPVPDAILKYGNLLGPVVASTEIPMPPAQQTLTALPTSPTLEHDRPKTRFRRAALEPPTTSKQVDLYRELRQLPTDSELRDTRTGFIPVPELFPQQEGVAFISPPPPEAYMNSLKHFRLLDHDHRKRFPNLGDFEHLPAIWRRIESNHTCPGPYWEDPAPRLLPRMLEPMDHVQRPSKSLPISPLDPDVKPFAERLPHLEGPTPAQISPAIRLRGARKMQHPRTLPQLRSPRFLPKLEGQAPNVPDDDGRRGLHSRGQLDTFIAQLIGEETEAARIGEKTEAALIGEETEAARIGEKTEAALIGEETEAARIGEKTEAALIGEETEAARIGEKTEAALIGEKTEAARIGEKTEAARIGEKTEAALVPTPFETSREASEGNDEHDTVTKPSHEGDAIHASHREAAGTALTAMERSEGHPRKPEAQDSGADANLPSTTQPSPRISLADRPACKNIDSKTKTADFVRVALDAHLAVKQNIRVSSDPLLRDVTMRKHRAGKKATYSQLMQKFSGLSSQEGNYE
ncbi:hypothetical protein CYMTET_50342, partial [Cymbomonas tetramitiformis]